MKKKSYSKEILGKYWKEIVLNIVILIIISLLAIIGPFVLKSVLSTNEISGFSAKNIGIYIIVITVLYAFKFLYNRFKFAFAEHFKNEETVSLYKRVFKMKYEAIKKLEPTYITERVSGTVDTVFGLYCSSVSGIFLSALVMLISLIIMIRINWILALLYFLQIPLQYIGFQRLLNGEKSKLVSLSTKLQTVRAKGNKNIKAIMSDIDSIKQHSAEDGILNFIRGASSDIFRMERVGNSYAMDVCTILEYISTLLKNGSYIFIIYLYVRGNVSVGDLVYLNLMNDLYFGSIGDVINIQINLRNLKGSLQFVNSEIDSNVEEDGDKEIIESVRTVEGHIRDLAYADDQIIVEDGSFKLTQGDIAAFTGDSGTGKSTIVKLLNKFMVGQDIKVNDISVSEIKNSSIRNKIYYLSQNSYLLPFTIKDNILLGNRNYDENRWNKLLSMPFMDKILAKGLETEVLENAENLSGGERQKVLLARIFMQNPDVIILDESFNSLDEKTGEEILGTVCDMYSDKIIVLISHAETYLKACNKRYAIHNKKLCLE